MERQFPTYFVLFTLLVIFVGACTFTQKIRDGEMAYERKQYAVAVEMLEEEYNRSKQQDVRARKAYLTALSYQRMEENKESLPWFKRAYEEGYGDEALHRYAVALKKDQQYRQAIEVWEQLLSRDPQQKYRRELGICRQVLDWLDHQEEQPYKVFRTGFNSSASDYAPVYFHEDQLVFTSDRENATGEDAYKWTGRAYSDFYIADLKTANVTKFSPLINTKQHEGTISFDGAYSMMVFSRCFQIAGEEDEYCKLMVSYRQGNGWSNPELLPFVKEQVNYAHPALDEEGRILVFASDAPDGLGGYDLYASRHEAGHWTEPVLMTERINTVGNEMFPYLFRDTLIFASDHLPGLGGLDLFKTYQRKDGSWNAPQNLMPPVNSGGDDFGWTMRNADDPYGEGMMEGYFSSTRSGGMGSDDIYAFKYDPSRVDILASQQENSKQEKEQAKEPVLLLEGKVRTPLYLEKDNPNSPRTGFKTMDSVHITVKKGNETRHLLTGREGVYRDTIAYGHSYEITASKESYLSSSRTLSSRNIAKPETGTKTLIIDFTLDRIYYEQEIVLRNIYYDYDRWNIREDAKPTLDSLADVLKWNPGINIQLSSHTDCRGTEGYNQELSQKRARSAVEYLISVGIDPARLRAKGYGEAHPAVDCPCAECTEEEHQANRRTTFKIIEDSGNSIE